MKRYKAYNKVTGLWFTGGGFNGPADEAIILEPAQLAFLRMAWHSVVAVEV